MLPNPKLPEGVKELLEISGVDAHWVPKIYAENGHVCDTGVWRIYCATSRNSVVFELGFAYLSAAASFQAWAIAVGQLVDKRIQQHASRL
jgi:hypothetical protein